MGTQDNQILKIQYNIENILNILNKIEVKTENQNELNSEIKIMLSKLENYDKYVLEHHHSKDEIITLKDKVGDLEDSLKFVRKTIIGAVLSGVMVMLLNYNFNGDKIKQPVNRPVIIEEKEK